MGERELEWEGGERPLYSRMAPETTSESADGIWMFCLMCCQEMSVQEMVNTFTCTHKRRWHLKVGELADVYELLFLDRLLPSTKTWPWEWRNFVCWNSRCLRMGHTHKWGASQDDMTSCRLHHFLGCCWWWWRWCWGVTVARVQIIDA